MAGPSERRDSPVVSRKLAGRSRLRGISGEDVKSAVCAAQLSRAELNCPALSIRGPFQDKTKEMIDLLLGSRWLSGAKQHLVNKAE